MSITLSMSVTYMTSLSWLNITLNAGVSNAFRFVTKYIQGATQENNVPACTPHTLMVKCTKYPLNIFFLLYIFAYTEQLDYFHLYFITVEEACYMLL